MQAESISKDPRVTPLEADFAQGQYPAYLMPDGTWRYGINAKRIADAAWGNRHRPSADQSPVPYAAPKTPAYPG